MRYVVHHVGPRVNNKLCAGPKTSSSTAFSDVGVETRSVSYAFLPTINENYYSDIKKVK